ncbi:hypothetical protein AB832_06620 [Flavobacteriaceae bacterium (ex Bugula neritina AB1)]|nr:hypothetical protein AB832_06620 [Flavobacteriaceae bacterium (ex Bugula neritina AB1)]
MENIQVKKAIAIILMLTIVTIGYPNIALSYVDSSVIVNFTDAIHKLVHSLFGANKKTMSKTERNYNLLLVKTDILDDLDHFPRSLCNFSKYFLTFKKAYYQFLRTRINDQDLLNDIQYFLTETYINERNNIILSKRLVNTEDEEIRIHIIESMIKKLKEDTAEVDYKKRLEICKSKVKSKLYRVFHHNDLDFKECESIVAKS